MKLKVPKEYQVTWHVRYKSKPDIIQLVTLSCTTKNELPTVFGPVAGCSLLGLLPRKGNGWEGKNQAGEQQ